MVSSSILELESWLQEKCQQVDEVLGAIKTSNLGLSLLVLLSLLSPLVEDLLISDLPHLLGVAVLDVECIVALKENIFGKLFGKLALVLLLEVDECLGRSWNNLDFGQTITLGCRIEVDSEFFFSCAEREVLDEQTEVHD